MPCAIPLRSQATLRFAILMGAFIAAPLSTYAEELSTNWPDFRGPRGDGHAIGSVLPIKWSETEQVRWKVAVPGKGWSSPVVWGNQVWLSTASEDGKRRLALAFDRETGKVIHEVTLFEIESPETINETNTFASPSPVIEEGRIYLHFGSAGTACVDTLSAKILWKRDDLKVNHKEGAGSSPLLAGDLLVIPCDGIDQQFVAALNKQTGETVWKVQRSVDFSAIRDDMRKAFSTPILHQEGDRKLVIIPGAHATMAYELTSGQEVWKYRYNGFSNVSRPIVGHGMVFLNTGYMRPRVLALRLGSAGEVSDANCAWSIERATPNKPSLLLVDDLVYMITDKGGILTCMDAKSGEQVYQERLGGNFSASPLFANGLIYLCEEEGRTTVIRHGRKFETVAVNELAEGCMACPAASGNSLILRTRTQLYRIGQ